MSKKNKKELRTDPDQTVQEDAEEQAMPDGGGAPLLVRPLREEEQP